MTKKAKILVIDDDPIIRDTLSEALELEGFCVDTAQNGKEAIEKSYATLYNLAIIDSRLPDIEGTKLLRELKETKPKMCKIMLTGYPSMNNAITALNEGADAFLLKPIEVKLLAGKITQLLKGQEEARKLIEYASAALKLSQAINSVESDMT
jgi:DNA-binding response OmpR family regulator